MRRIVRLLCIILHFLWWVGWPVFGLLCLIASILSQWIQWVWTGKIVPYPGYWFVVTDMLLTFQEKLTNNGNDKK